MGLVINILILVAGFAALIKGADIFVDGSSGLAKKFKVPSLIIGLTIVALGTSLPELAVSTSAALKGANEIALSNIVGSNIFNLLMVLGVAALFREIPVDKAVIKRDFPVCLFATILLLGMAGIPILTKGGLLKANMRDKVGELTRICGLVFIVILIIYIVYLVVDARRHPVAEEESSKLLPLWK
nr:sodium:calcium antiporter [Saccharofermentans sp.]